MVSSKLEINLTIYKENLKKIKSIIPGYAQIMAIVKANGYGLGSLKLVEAAKEIGIQYFGVANVKEAIELRKYDSTLNILLLSEPYHSHCKDIVEYNLTATVYTKEFCRTLQQFAKKENKKLKVHIKVDTGMRRVGTEIEETLPLCHYIMSLSQIKIEGLYTHFANANNPESDFNKIQLKKFNEVITILKKENIKIPIIHAANTYATRYIKDAHFNMVRIGLGALENIISLKSYISLIKKVPINTPVGYEGIYTTNEETHIGIIPLGYADGIPLELANKGKILINDEEYPIIGKICMDMITVNLGKSLKIEKDATVTLLGKDKKKEILLEEYIELTNTQARYLMCNLGNRINREYFI